MGGSLLAAGCCGISFLSLTKTKNENFSPGRILNGGIASVPLKKGGAGLGGDGGKPS